MSVRVTVVDEQTGDREETTVPDGDYLIIVTKPAYISSTQTFLGSGTHVLTVKGRLERSPMGRTVHYAAPSPDGDRP